MEIKVITGAIDCYKLGDIAEYSDEVAEKLVSLGFAEPVSGPAPEPSAEAVALEDMKLDELKELCRDLGLPTGGKKDDLIERINSAEEGAADEPEGDAPDDDEPPALNAEVPR